ncbi:Crp/Fnr family transcriptional regulator [Chloroflexota bacterium]
MSVQLEFLKSNPYFSDLSPAELDSVKNLLFERTTERGEIILFEGEPADTLFFVISGAVKVFKTSAEGKEQILNIVRPGESFNDVPIYDNGTNLASAQAMGPVTLYWIKKGDLKEALRNHPKLSLNIINVLAKQVRRLVSIIEDLSFRHVIGRVAKILLEHTGDESGFGPKLTHQEIAAIAGTAREVVGRSLKSLEDEGLIRFERHRIIITNKKALEKIIGEPD